MNGVKSWAVRIFFVIAFIMIVLIAIDIVALFILRDSSEREYLRGQIPSDAPPDITVQPSETILIPDYLIVPETSVSTITYQTTSATETTHIAETTTEAEPETEPEIEEPLPPHSYASQVQESDAVSDDYFSKAVFIGDSRTVGFCNFTNISPYCYARVSLNVKSVLTSAFIEDTSTNPPMVRTVLETIKKYPNSFDKIYIGFGVNEYSMPGNLFITCYEHFVGELIDVLPEGTPIYIQSVLPINEKQAAANGYSVKNKQLMNFNDLLVEMCGGYDNVHFVNTAEAVIADGLFTLPDKVSNDGIHMNMSTCNLVKDYLYTHTVK